MFLVATVVSLVVTMPLIQSGHPYIATIISSIACYVAGALDGDKKVNG